MPRFARISTIHPLQEHLRREPAQISGRLHHPAHGRHQQIRPRAVVETDVCNVVGDAQATLRDELAAAHGDPREARERALLELATRREVIP